MQLIYFDENKYSEDNPFFFIGGIVLDEEKASCIDNLLSRIQYNFFGINSLTKEYEFHGKEIFQGKGNYKKRALSSRIQLLRDLSIVVVDYKIPINLVCIDVNAHRRKYKFPEPEYRLGLMFFLERCCDYLDEVEDIGLVFGDYEKDEIANSIIDFSQFKTTGKTMYRGRPLGRLIDTIYFTQSHHSRFLQLADVILFMAQRYENDTCQSTKWHDNQARDIWNNIKANVDIRIQHWP